MADTIRRCDYYYVTVEDRAGEGARVLGKLKEAGVNLLAFNAFPAGGGKAQLTLVPEKPEALASAARGAGFALSPKKECIVVQGSDRVGAVQDILKKLAEARVSCVGSNAVAAPGGSFGMALFVKPADLAAACKALGI
ncbi:MAG TPA: hypothetical protein VFR85_04870 [Anaeromyxobacteraceae bacterium]|nr:hypothetical protein [Anaeromyxobacteraceae bacterium]